MHGELDDEDEFDLDEVDEQLICPVCKLNFVAEGENMCESCLEEHASVAKEEQEDEEWPRSNIDHEADDEDIDLLPPADEQIDEELGNTFAKDLDEEFEDSEEIEEFDEDLDDDFDLDLDALDGALDDEDEDEEDEEEEEDEEDY